MHFFQNRLSFEELKLKVFLLNLVCWSFSNLFVKYFSLERSFNCFHKSHKSKHKFFCRYIDDLFMACNSFCGIELLKQEFKANSTLKCTNEIECNKNIVFLDTLLSRAKEALNVNVFRQETNTGEFWNYGSLCTQRYKTGVIKTFLHRAYNVYFSWKFFNADLLRMKQLLVNYKFPNQIIN